MAFFWMCEKPCVKGSWHMIVAHIISKSYPFLECIRDVKRSSTYTWYPEFLQFSAQVLPVRFPWGKNFRGFRMRASKSAAALILGGSKPELQLGLVGNSWGEDWNFWLGFKQLGFWGTFFLERKKMIGGHLHQVKKMGWVFMIFLIHIKFVLILGSKDVWNIYIKSTPHIVRMHSPFRC